MRGRRVLFRPNELSERYEIPLAEASVPDTGKHGRLCLYVVVLTYIYSYYQVYILIFAIRTYFTSYSVRYFMIRVL